MGVAARTARTCRPRHKVLRSGTKAGDVRLQGWADLVERIMEQDWSWSEPALDYIELYYKAIKG